MQPLDWRAHCPDGPDQRAEIVEQGTLCASWAKRWAESPGAPILYVADGETAKSRWVTAGELDDRSRRTAERLIELGFAGGARVAWNAKRSLGSIVSAVAVLRSGNVLVPMDTTLAEREVRHVVGEVAPAAAITDDVSGAMVMLEESQGSGNELVAFDSEIRHLGATVTATVPIDVTSDLDAASPDAPALIGFTSGTTGAPKGAVLTQANMLANAESLRLAWHWTPEDRLIHALPLFHGHGLCAALFGTFHVGASAVILEGFDSGAVFDAAQDHGASMFFGVPTMYHRIAASGRARDLAKLRLSVSGSAPLAAELHQELEEASGTRVLERYGMTETLLTVSNPYLGERRAGSIGFPLPGTEAFVDDEASSGAPREPELGDGAELVVRGPTVFSGYFGKPAQTAERLSEDGWFRTGDIGVVEDWYVRLLGRSTEVVITGGHNVYPAEVEDVLLGYPGVAEVAVSGTPSDEWGEVVTAWVVPSDRLLDVDGLLAHAAKALSSYKRPRIVRAVDSLPRNSMGKVMRRNLGT